MEFASGFSYRQQGCDWDAVVIPLANFWRGRKCDRHAFGAWTIRGLIFNVYSWNCLSPLGWFV
jgi:hypothetical protein